ncbi:hypothetical protein MGH68_14185 [Erysipelothrix sp. D19-032]
MLVAFAISNLKDLNYGGIIMPLIIAFALNDDLFYFRGNIWWLIWGGIFLSIGLHSLFPRKSTILNSLAKRMTHQNPTLIDMTSTMMTSLMLR